jgi:hypothetical protein
VDRSDWKFRKIRHDLVVGFIQSYRSAGLNAKGDHMPQRGGNPLIQGCPRPTDTYDIARLIDARRRGATGFGIPNQLAIFFDGLPQTPGGYESTTTAGDVGRCIKEPPRYR